MKRKLATRIYLATMRFEGMNWVKVRRSLLAAMGARIGHGVNIFAHVVVDGAERLTVGNSVSFNRDCNVSAAGGLKIGDHVSVGHSTTILTVQHSFDDSSVPIQLQPITYASVTIGDNVWVGARAIILAGVSLAEGTIIGAGAVVTRSIHEPYCTLAGNPARVIKRRRPTAE